MDGQMALIECPECRGEVSSAAASCPNCGFPINQSQQESQKRIPLGITANEDLKLLELILKAHYTKDELWTRDEIKIARELLIKHFGKVIDLNDCHLLCTDEELDAAIGKLISDQRSSINFEMMMNGTNSPCHLCGSEDSLTKVQFGLAKIISKKLDWKKTAASVAGSIAISAVTAPLLGVWGYSITGKTTKANIIRLYLVICNNCRSIRKKLLGGLKITEQDYKKHPCFNSFFDIGYTKILPKHELDQFKSRS